MKKLLLFLFVFPVLKGMKSEKNQAESSRKAFVERAKNYASRDEVQAALDIIKAQIKKEEDRLKWIRDKESVFYDKTAALLIELKQRQVILEVRLVARDD